MGTSADTFDDRLRPLCHALGRAIVESGCCIVTGACPGIPHEVVLAAHAAGGRAIGISPATNLKEHVERYDSPYHEYETMIFTGLGLMGREVINIRSSDMIIIIGGRSGTLGEFAIAYDEGKLIGVLDHTGGIADVIPEIARRIGKATGAEVIRATDAQALVKAMLDRYFSPDYQCPGNPSA
ncbi:MAG: hypothetical protein K8S54_02120 [Spirochaetia bacterium]|nr:hypothetical protein [Spirochaetia bacterium]